MSVGELGVHCARQIDRGRKLGDRRSVTCRYNTRKYYDDPKPSKIFLKRDAFVRTNRRAIAINAMMFVCTSVWDGRAICLAL